MALLTGLVLATVACSSAPPKGALKPVAERKAAPEFTLKNAAGDPLKLSDFRGKAVLLNFWATWCVPCKVELPWFVEFHNELQSRNFTVLGLSMDEEGFAAVTPFAAAQKMTYPLAIAPSELLSLYAVESLPTTFMIDREGRIAAVHTGLVSKETYRDDVLALVAE
jgi:peroxiredoxin